MKTKNIGIDKIKPYGKNAKKHTDEQIDNVAKSIKEYGFVQPIVIDKDGVIVIGHCRFEASKRLGLKEVPVVCVDDLTPEQVKALRIVDNKVNESEWDLDLLNEELGEIDLSGFDFNLPKNIEISDEMLDDFFEDAQQTQKEPKKIMCPHCLQWFEL